MCAFCLFIFCFALPCPAFAVRCGAVRCGAASKWLSVHCSQTEQALLDQEHAPETAEEFDRMVLASPNNSLVWLQYMALHLHTTEIDKARVVAERALKTISFRFETFNLSGSHVYSMWSESANQHSHSTVKKKSPQTFAHLVNFSKHVSAMFDNHTILLFWL